jgi:hypothetical protein
LTQEFTGKADSKSITVTTNRAFTVTPDAQTWYSAVKGEGNTVIISVNQNIGEVGSQPRTAEVTLASEGSPNIMITINQSFLVWMVNTIIGQGSTESWNSIGDGNFTAQHFSFDPKNPDHLYLSGDGLPLRRIDFSNNTVTTIFNNNYSHNEVTFSRYKHIAWTLSGDEMIIATAMGVDLPNAMRLTRAGNFMDATNFLPYNVPYSASVAVHPVNGELYYSQWYGSVGAPTYKYDWATQQAELTFAEGREYFIIIHPTGNYAYLVDLTQHCIWRSNYNWASKKFEAPTLAFGAQGTSGWEDGIGTETKFYQPMQGVFVKNSEYVGDADEYDFYVADEYNHCIRKITPEGVVSTFAGLGPTLKGDVNGDLSVARFDCPPAITYDEKRDCFYVGVRWSAAAPHDGRIVKIALE